MKQHMVLLQLLLLLHISFLCVSDQVVVSNDSVQSATVNSDAVKDVSNPYKQKAFEACFNQVTARFGGKYRNEFYASSGTNFLNNGIGNDFAIFVRSTADFFLDFLYGDCVRPRLELHDTIRFRHKWASGPDVKNLDGTFSVVDVSFANKGSTLNKHVLWTREAWLKIALGNIQTSNDHFLQFGLVDYSVGRGISLGSAYRASDFLGFAPGYSIDQFAPGVVVQVNPIYKKLLIDWYFALLENPHTSFKNNNEEIRKNEINTCAERGPHRFSYVTAMRSKWVPVDNDKQSLLIEPYIVHQHAPDQNLEFSYDSDSFLTTFGVAVEGGSRRMTYGFECGFNQGQQVIKPWDRNSIKLAKNDDGLIEERFTKVFTTDPAVAGATVAIATKNNTTAVNGSSRDVGLNGHQFSTIPALFNAFDRFRPSQKKNFDGYFFVADGSYEWIEDCLVISAGAGYASGDLDEQLDMNKLSQQELHEQRFAGFIPLQSIYSGTRLRHLVLFNEGVPRFVRRYPNATLNNVNVSGVVQKEGVLNQFTNISFVGASADWKVRYFKSSKCRFSPNIIFYWMADTPQFSDDCCARNFMGTELSAEVSAVLYDRLKISGYFGALLPGGHYKDMAGTLIGGQKVGCDVAYIINLGATFAF